MLEEARQYSLTNAPPLQPATQSSAAAAQGSVANHTPSSSSSSAQSTDPTNRRKTDGLNYGPNTQYVEAYVPTLIGSPFIKCAALLDTGCLAGDCLSEEVADALCTFGRANVSEAQDMLSKVKSAMAENALVEVLRRLKIKVLCTYRKTLG